MFGMRHRRFAHRELGPEPGRHGRGHHGGRRHGFRPGRMFGQGDLRNVILGLLAEAPRHGYDIIKAIEELFGGTYSPSPGAIYPTLAMLEDLGLATVSAAESGKKSYAITAEGRAWLDVNRDAVDTVFARIRAVAQEATGGPMEEVHRAMKNVGRAVYLREGRKPWTADQAQRVAELLDRTAGEIEQIQ
jgi:DNA-binding PadR family transcriptional regulator